jgi:ankyrin repeat protein
MVVPAQVKSAVSKMFSVSHDRSQIIATYNERYDLALERITNQPSYQAELARATLAWITFAYRPLTPAELCHALAMSLTDDHTNLSQDYLPEVGLLVSICAGLVTVDEQVNVVRPVHYTTQEYLKRTYEVWFPSCRNHLASTCISYLLLDEFKKGGIKSTSEDEDEYQRRLTRYPFFSYVAHYWGKHAQLVEDVVLTGICTVLKHDDILDSISSVTTCSWDHGNYDFINIRRWKKLSPLLIIARDGLLQTLQYYLSEGHIEAKSDNHEHIIISIGSDSVLSVAAANGHLDVVKTILDQTVDISLQDGSGQALIEAASGGFADIAQLILDFWTKLTQSQPLSTEEISEAMDRALNEAAGSSRKEMMQLLFREGAHIRYCMAQYIDNDPEKGLRLALQMGFEVDARDYFGNTALQTAANRGYTQSVQILLEHGADASAKSKEMGPPLEEAAYEQHKNTIQVLIDHGVDVEAQCSQCDTALVAALCAENWAWDFNVVRLLLEAGAQPDKHHHQDTRLALHRAAYAGYTDFCELLLLHGADVNLRSGAPPQSALEEAYKVARANVVRLLLSKGAQAPEGGLSFSGEFMYYWVQNEKYAIEVLKLFREHRIKMDFVGNGAHLPAIYEAAQMGCSKVLNELLDLGADINVQAGKHGNVLHTAIVGKESDSSGDPDCVIILLDHGADINGSGLVHSTPLGAAIEASSGTFGTDEIFRTLVERGAKVGHHGPALLGPAVASGQKYIVQYLLTAGVDMESLPMSPNLLATACRLDRSEEILTILLDAGADIQMWGPAALHQAVSAYKPDAVRWLLQHGVDANEPSEDCPNALITCVSAPPNAIYEMNFVAPIIETLTEHGADLETHGPAALELAIANDYSSKIRVLLGGTPKPHAEGDDYDSDGFGFRDITIRHRDDD